jgi:hypothetical protein
LLQKEDQEAEENCVPLSEVRVCGTPKHGTQVDRKACMQEPAAIPLRGIASTHTVVLSTIIMRYSKLSLDTGIDPMRSVCTLLNLRCGMGMGWMEA